MQNLARLILVWGLGFGLGQVFPAAAQSPLCDDFIYAVVDEGNLALHHQGAEYNCCPIGFTYDFSFEGETLRVTESEILPEPCDCNCCFDLVARLADVPPGQYSVIFKWFNYESWSWQEWLLEVSVPEAGQTGDPVLAAVNQSDCYWETTGVETSPAPPGPSPATWGTLKATYR
jgi:hypothetical protein